MGVSEKKNWGLFPVTGIDPLVPNLFHTNGGQSPEIFEKKGPLGEDVFGNPFVFKGFFCLLGG
jgi:hypothetical protein